MTSRKIVGVFGLGLSRSLPHDSFAVHHSDGGLVTCGHDYVRSLLPRCGQRVDHLPEVGEMVIPEDIPTPVPLPEQWINLYATPAVWAWRTREEAATQTGRLAVVHIWTDAEGDHAKIEREDTHHE